MAIFYKLAKNTNQKSASYGKYSGRAVVTETKGINELAQHMANHGSPYSKGTIQGVITDMVGCIRELALSGVATKLDNLAIFSLGIETSHAEAGKFTVKDNVKRYKLRARATGEFSSNELKNAVSVSEWSEYSGDSEEEGGE